MLSNFEAAGIASAAVIFNESERDCEAYVRQRYPRLVATVLVKNTRSSFESFREILAAAPPGGCSSPRSTPSARARTSWSSCAAPGSSADATVLAVTGYVHDEKPLWVRIGRPGRRAGSPRSAATRATP